METEGGWVKLLAPGLADRQVMNGRPFPGSLNVQPGLQTARCGLSGWRPNPARVLPNTRESGGSPRGAGAAAPAGLGEGFLDRGPEPRSLRTGG